MKEKGILTWNPANDAKQKGAFNFILSFQLMCSLILTLGTGD